MNTDNNKGDIILVLPSGMTTTENIRGVQICNK